MCPSVHLLFLQQIWQGLKLNNNIIHEGQGSHKGCCVMHALKYTICVFLPGVYMFISIRIGVVKTRITPTTHRSEVYLVWC